MNIGIGKGIREENKTFPLQFKSLKNKKEKTKIHRERRVYLGV